MNVVLEKKVAKYLERLNEPIKGKIITALRKLAMEPPHYRILFKDKITFIAVYKIAPRGQAYKET